MVAVDSLQKCLSKELGARGAEMIEYALVLACVAAVAVFAYTVGEGTSGAYFKVNIMHLWEAAGNSIGSALGWGN